MIISAICVFAALGWLIKAEMGRRHSSFVTTPVLSQLSESAWAVTLAYFAITSPGKLPLVLALAALFHSIGALVKTLSYEPPPFWWPKTWIWFKHDAGTS